MYRQLAYSFGSLMMGGAALWFNPILSKSKIPSPIGSTGSEVEKVSKLDYVSGFPSVSLISIDPFGNIIIANREHPDLVRGIHPNGQLSPALGSLHEAGNYFSSGYGGEQEGMFFGGGGGYPIFNGGDIPSGSASAGGATGPSPKLKDSPKINEGKAPYSSNVSGSGRTQSFDSGFGGGGLGNSGGNLASGGGAVPVSEDSPSISKGVPLVEGLGAEKNPGVSSSVGSGPDASNSQGSNPGLNLSIPSDLAQADAKNGPNDSEPDFIPLSIPAEKTDERKDNQNAMNIQPPDRRNGAGNAEDAAKNAIPPILMNADEEKDKAKKEREKIPPNEQKAREHDNKAAALMAQAAAMAAAMAGNNNAKNKADSRDGEEQAQQPLQIPDFTQLTEDRSSERNRPQTVWIPNPRKDRTLSSESLGNDSNDNSTPNPTIFIR